MQQPWKRLSDLELQAIRARMFHEVPVMVSIEQTQRLINERDALEHALVWSKDGKRAKNEFLTLLEHISELKEENAELKRRLAQNEQQMLVAAI